MKKFLGPILSFRSSTDDVWRVSCLFVTDLDPGSLHYGSNNGRQAVPNLLYEYKGRKVWRYDMQIPLTESEQIVEYSQSDIAEEGWAFSVPGTGKIPKAAYASCNGFGHLKEAKKVKDINFLWKHMAGKHSQGKYHLLLMGGDQVYGDQIWEVVPEIAKWSQKEQAQRLRASFTSLMADQVNNFYFDLYCKRWSQPEMQHIFASIPTIMMWDDHDIFDGWGSHPEELQTSPVFQGIYKAAQLHFGVFQQQLAANERHPSAIGSGGFSMGFNIGDLALVVLDMRSERTNGQVISSQSWQNIYEWLEKVSGIKHLFVMSSIPIVHPDFSMIEGILGVFPGQQDLEDDLRDHWHSRGHRGERLRLIHRLLSLADQEGFRVTILSGDVHVAALGVINSDRSNGRSRAQVVNQLTSSGIVHPAPPAVVLLALKILGAKAENVDQGITAELINFPGTNHSFIGARNWLSLEPDDRNRIWANWFVEGDGDQSPYTKVIHPVGFEQ